MSVNASACWLKILIGDDQQDWSKERQTFDVNLPKRDRSGLLPITGTLTLTYSDDAPESMNPRVNAQRWHRGQSIKVYASLDGVTYTPHPCGWLYILKEPLPPHPDTPELTLQVGCQLALKDFAEPDNDKSGVILGVATSRTDAITPILAAAGITSWVGDVPAYPIAHPLPKLGGSYVQQAGKVAYAGQKALWQDSQGQIQAVDLRLDPTATPVVDITIGPGGGEIIYQPSEGAETPVEELRCVGIDKIGIDTWRCLSSLPNEHYETTNNGGVVSTRILRRTTITDCQGLDEAGQFYKSRREFVEETAGMVYPNDEPGSLRLTFSSDSTTTYLYEPGVTGRLLNTRRLVLRPTAAAVASWWANLSAEQKLSYSRISPLPATDELTTFNYQDYPTPQDGSVADQYAFNYQTQVVAGQTVATKAPIAAIAPNEDLLGSQIVDPLHPPIAGVTSVDPLSSAPSGLTQESWAKVRGYEWQKSTITQAPFITAAPEAAANSTSISSKIALVTTDDVTDVSAAGGQQPAAPERRPDRYTEIEIQIKGRALFGTPAGSNEQKRFRTIEVEYMVSAAQASAIAEMEGSLLIGRRQGQTILVPFDDRFLSIDEDGHGFSPLHLWRCTEPDGTTYIYQADAISFTHDTDRAVVGCQGIWQATIPAGATAHKLPYNVIMPMDGGICFGGNIRVYPYSLAPVTLTMLGGIKFGGRLAPITTINMRGGLKFGGSFEGKLARSVFGGIKFGGNIKLAAITRSFRGGLKFGGRITPTSTGYDPATDVLLARFAGDYSSSRLTAIDTFIRALKTGGGTPANATWDTLDALWLMAAPVAGDAALNWKGTGFTLTPVGSPAFTADRGYATNGSSSYLNTNYNPRTAGGNYTVDSATIGVYSRTSSPQTARDMGAFDGSYVTDLGCKYSDGSSYIRLNSIAGTGVVEFDTNDAPNGLGAFSASRNSASNLNLYVRGVATTNINTGATFASSNTPNLPYFIGGWNVSGSLSGAANREYAAGWLASGWTAGQNAAFYTALQNYLTNIGANV